MSIIQLCPGLGRLCLMWIFAVLAQGSFASDASSGAFDARDYKDLNQVIMLCATAPASENFATAWQEWLRRNPDADVQAAVDTVISRSGTIRSMAIPGMKPVSQGRRPDPHAIADLMLSLAGRASAPR